MKLVDTRNVKKSCHEMENGNNINVITELEKGKRKNQSQE